jgi:hypothetical protein
MKITIKLVIVAGLCYALISLLSLMSIEKSPLIYEGIDKLKYLINNSELDSMEYINVANKYDMLKIYNGIKTNEFFDDQTNVSENNKNIYDKEQIKDIIKEIAKSLSETGWAFKEISPNKLTYNELVDFGEYIVIKYSFNGIDKTGLKKYYNYAFLLEVDDSLSKDEFHAFIFWTCLKYLDGADICVRLPIKEDYYYEIWR